MESRETTVALVLIVLLSMAPLAARGEVTVAAGGRLIRHAEQSLVLVGDSGTQCVMQDLNIDYRHWIDDCAQAGLNAIHVWSFMAPRQTTDGKVVEARYGYVFPGATPWARHRDGPTAHDGDRQWDLLAFDEGSDAHEHYWPRLRDLCQYARQKNMLVGITVFFGWPKHQSDWVYHPMNRINGGHLADKRPLIEAVQQIATPGKEVLELAWSDRWSDARKTQWIWEQFAAKLIGETKPIGNVFFIFMDERSYSEGNCGDHFAEFFRRRGAFWVDGQLRRERIDAVVGGHGAGRDINRSARDSFAKRPPRPFIEFELPPYQGKAVRRNLYACLLGGGHYFFHDDQDQETPTTGVMAYDPMVKHGNLKAVRERLRWLGIACRLMNQQVRQRLGMEPRNEVIQRGRGYCLARPGKEYVVYVPTGGNATLQLDRPANEFEATVINPRTGQVVSANTTTVERDMHIKLPDQHDWLIHVTRKQ